MTDTLPPSRDALHPRFAGILTPSIIRGRRECRMRAAPAVSCAVCTKNGAHEHTGQRRTSDIPCAMALRLIACSPRRTALLPPLRPGKSLPPGALTPAPRRQDQRLCRTRLAPSSQAPSASTASPSHVRDDRERPSGRDGMAKDIHLIFVSGKANYFRFSLIFRLT